ncbi:homeobox-leucine zipper protein ANTHOCYANINLESS 2-like [Malania oleifera]|uniref:homeobox-leucine zipper protein ANTHOCYANINLESS 2-like n=1 Tax=Malania oleifera TaxID=397392 RepID=UPI0025AE4AB9|nr:homeobox-leucine zipper protein ANTHOCYANINLESS 2-like [Malania oleifera]XP_057950556.1 homeobox-leucine zipper protein ANTHOCYANINLESS 2-like [Malania oleifera]XP_057950557.1 homeobox-leucine zipper protein ANTHOCYANINLESS 2-like [Malania oleifera]XP_057950559.1 homeobox-leucine zipper protein ANTHOCYANINLESS 2-like [Malania oleifera]XP_057950560.1 homeobox-leucine zipper protein ANTHOCYANINLESS 2-like [Malania oleifera]
MSLIGENLDPTMMGRIKEDEYESRSGSDNLDAGGSGDDQDADDKPPRKKKYHRHTPQQIQELEAFFKECPHPDDKQRLELSRKLSLETKQVKFWFQNRRTQMKAQIERHENIMLKQENEKLRVENMAIQSAAQHPVCNNCGGPAIIGVDVSYEEHQLRIENAQLKEELHRIYNLAQKLLGKSVSAMDSSIASQLQNSSLDLAMERNGLSCLSPLGSTLPMGLDLGNGVSNMLPLAPPNRSTTATTSLEKSMLLELAITAVNELFGLVETDSPLWVKTLDGGKEVLNHEEYRKKFFPCIGSKPRSFVTEATRETGIVNINSLALVETLMDANRWMEMFPHLIARSSIIEVISSGMGGTKNGTLQLMHAEYQVLSPLVPVRQVKFLRFCEQRAEGVWAVVDVSIDSSRESSNAQAFVNCRRLPSGCVVQDVPNGYSKVTWVEHSDYDENVVHHLFRPLISSGMGFGAPRWLATLQRQCECLATLLSSTIPGEDRTAIPPNGRESMLKLAQRMIDNFCAGICTSAMHKWEELSIGNLGPDVKVMTRKSVDDPGEPPGVVLSATSSVWIHVPQQQLFDFLRDERLRSKWDILSNGGPMREMVNIPKGRERSNCVSLLCASAMTPNQNNMLILQETWKDASGSLIVYAPVDVASMHAVMSGGDAAYVALLPSGFSIVPDGCPGYGGPNGCNGTLAKGGSNGCGDGSGSLLSIGFQILVNDLPTSKLTVESVQTVSNLISCTIQKIKDAL